MIIGLSVGEHGLTGSFPGSLSMDVVLLGHCPSGDGAIPSAQMWAEPELSQKGRAGK